MKRYFAVSLLLSVAVVIGGCAPAIPPPPAVPPQPVADAPADIAALDSARAAFMAGYEAGDAEGIGRLYAADAISEPNNQPTLNGRDAIVASLRSMFEQVSVKTVLTPDGAKTRGTIGVDRGHYTVTVTPKAGAPATSSEGRYLVIYIKDADGTWKAWRDMDNAAGAPAPKPAADPATVK